MRTTIDRWWLLALAALLVLPAAAGDWPQFRGRDRDGVAHGEELARSWGEGEPRLLWRRPLGAGFSGVAAVGERLYTLAAEGEVEEVFALDGASGRTLWRVKLGKRFVSPFGDGPRSTPTVADGVVYAVSSDMQLAALRATDGEVLWRRDLVAELGAEVPRRGFSPSPLVDGERLVLEVGGEEDKGVVAFDRKSGELLWASLGWPAGSSSPVAVEVGDRRQYVFVRRVDAETGEIVALSTEGEPLWRHPNPADTIVTPVITGPGRFFVSSATSEKGGVLLEVTARDGNGGGGGFEVRELWSNPRMRNHFSTSVRVDGHLYGFDNATLRCLDAATGEIRWSHRGFGKGTLAAADGLLFVLGDDGVLALAEASPEAFRERGRVQALDGRTWTAPTVAHGRVIVRDHEEIAAYDVAARGAEAGGRTTIAAEPETARRPPPRTTAEAIERYVAARGGRERWEKLTALELRGTYATFSQPAPFTLARRRGDLYRFDFRMAGEPAIEARDADGPWARLHLLGMTEPTRVEDEPYASQIERKARFLPPLFSVGRGVEARLVGPGEIDGRPTTVIEVTLPGGAVETWHLDPRTDLEVAIETTVYDYTQGTDPLAERTSFSDFREVGGLVIPHRVSIEFGARLEEMAVERARIDPSLPAEAFRLPAAASQAAAGKNENPP